MRARPEPTQLEHLSDASFFGKLLVFPAIVRLDWKVIASTNTVAYLASSTVMKEKCFITLTPDEALAPLAVVLNVALEGLEVDALVAVGVPTPVSLLSSLL